MELSAILSPTMSPGGKIYSIITFDRPIGCNLANAHGISRQSRQLRGSGDETRFTPRARVPEGPREKAFATSPTPSPLGSGRSHRGGRP